MTLIPRPRPRLETLEDRAVPATFTVLNADDSGPGSFRQAFTDAHNAATDDTIAFDPTFFATPRTINQLSSLPTLAAGSGALTIAGPGENLLTIQRGAGAPNFGLLLSSAPSLAISGLTMSGGNTPASGGALQVGGTVTLDHVVLTGNRAAGPGGAIRLAFGSFLTLRNSVITGNTAGNTGGAIYMFGGGLLMENSTLSNNVGGGRGGGLYFFGQASPTPPAGFTPNTLVIRNSTIADNAAIGGGGVQLAGFAGTLSVEGSTVSGNTVVGNGGGINIESGSLTVLNSTFTGNVAGAPGQAVSASSGGAIAAFDATAVRVRNSTIVGNTAQGGVSITGGGGIARTAASPGVLEVTNSVVAGNTNANAPDILTHIAGTTVNVNFSAVGSPAGFTPSGTSGNNVPFGTDLKLAPLAFVGGPTRSFAPIVGSPLVDAGSNALIPAGVTTDQRGGAFSRTVGTVDIGSIESQGPFIPTAASAPPPVTAPGATAYQFPVTYSDVQGVGGAIDTAGIINNNAAVRVTGPGGFNAAATFVSIDNPADGTPRTATYSIVPPGGSWDALDNGTYTVRVQPGQVADVDGNFVVADAVGTFAVRASIVVTTADDAGPGSLRDAIAVANGTPTADVIEFSPAAFSIPQTIGLQTALPTIATAGGALTITGPGEGLLTVRRSAATEFRVFTSTAPAITLTGLTISGGKLSGPGGGLQAAGTVVLDHVTLTGNQAGTGGGLHLSFGSFLTLRDTTITGNVANGSCGGIYMFGGSLLMEDSTISGNTAATGQGGGLYFFGTASQFPPAGFLPNGLTIRNSTISGNTAATNGGGVTLPSFQGTLLVQNSIVSGNTAAGNGGGIAASYGSVTLQNTTVTGNTAGVATGAVSTASGGGVAVTGGTGTLRVQNSTIVGNTAFGAVANTGGGGIARTVTSPGTITVTNSVIAGNTNGVGPDIVTGPTGTTVNVNFSAIGSPAGYTPSGTSGNNLPPAADLKLVPLAFVGGPTRSFAPAFGSPLVNAGSNALVPAGVTTDQRGGTFSRTVGVVDIGSVESQAPFIPIAAANASTVTTAGDTTYQFTVTYSDPQGPGGAIDTASILNNNAAVRVTGPNGFDAPATFVSIDNPADGTPRTATYSITPPGGSWDPADVGTYSVRAQSNQVADLEGNFVVADAVGTFDAQPPYVVTNANDTGPGSLRDAITQANATTNSDWIAFSPAVFNVPQTITLGSALPVFSALGGGLTIAGPGADLVTVRRPAAAPGFRPFASVAPATTLSGMTVTGGAAGGLQAGGTVTLDDMVFTGNTSPGPGGAIQMTVGSFLTLRNSVLTGNTANGSGGAVYGFGGGWLIENSTISNNASAAVGGGLYWFGAVSTAPPVGFAPTGLVVRNSTIDGNSAVAGGGVSLTSFTGTLFLQNSTVTGNTAATSGGAVSLTGGAGSVTVQNSTVVANTANGTAAGTGGGGLSRTSVIAGMITVANSVVAGNINANAPDILASGVTTTHVNFSAVENPTGFTPSGTSGNNVVFPTNLLLGPLVNNGGLTRTFAPQPGSPLINAGSDALVPAVLTTDQRGGTRDRKFGTVDIGAFEVQPPKVSIDQAAGQADPTNGSPILFTVHFNAPVTGFDATDLSFAGSTVGGTPVAVVTGSGEDYTVSVTGMSEDGTVVVSIPAGGAVDGSQSGNAASTSTDNSVRFDNVPSTVTIDQAAAQADPTNGSPVFFTVHFDEPVTGFDATDVSFAGSTVGGTLVANVTGSGADYTVGVSGMTGDGNVVVGIPAGSATDATGNLSLTSTSTDNSVRFDGIDPTVTVEQAVGQADPTVTSPISFAVHFTEPMTGFDAGDVSFAGSTVGGTPVANVSGAGADYTVTVTGMSGQGNVVVSIPAGGAADAAGNGNAASTSIDNSVRFDVVAPTVTVEQAVGQADPTNASPISFAVQFNEPVIGFTAADVTLGGTVGGTLVANVSGSGADYTVTVTGMSGVGTVVATIPAGVVVDGAGNTNLASTSTDNSVLFDNIGQLDFASAVFNATAEGGVVTVTVTRTGGSDGPVSIDLQTADGTAHSGGPTATGQDDYTPPPTTLTFSWIHGESGSKSFDIAIPDDPLNEGAEAFALSLVNPDGDPHVGLTAATAVIGPSDPLAASGTFLDQDGDKVTVKFSGAGQFALYRTDPDGDGRGPIERVELSNTLPDPLKPKTALSVAVAKAKGNTGPDAGLVGLGTVTGSGLKSFSAKAATLTGGIDLAGYVGSITVGNIANGADVVALGANTQKTKLTAGVIGDGTAIALGSAISGLTATRIGVGSITAPSIGTLTVKGNTKAAIVGDLLADVTVSGAGIAAGKPAIGTLSVAGSVPAGTEIVGPSIGTLTVKKDLAGTVTVSGTGAAPPKNALGTLKVTGAVTATTIDVSGNVGSVTAGTFVNSNFYAGYNSTLGTYSGRTVGKFTVTGKTDGFRNSFVYATNFKGVTLASVAQNNGSTPFGFTAEGAVTALSVTSPKFKYNPKDATNPQKVGDFEVRIV